MPRAKKPYVSFETPLEFDEYFREIQDAGYKKGFRRGEINALTHILGYIYHHFDSEIIDEANRYVKFAEIELRRQKEN